MGCGNLSTTSGHIVDKQLQRLCFYNHSSRRVESRLSRLIALNLRFHNKRRRQMNSVLFMSLVYYSSTTSPQPARHYIQLYNYNADPPLSVSLSRLLFLDRMAVVGYCDRHRGHSLPVVLLAPQITRPQATGDHQCAVGRAGQLARRQRRV